MMKNTKWYMLVVVLLLGAFMLVACGGGTTETAEEPVATEAPEEPTEEPAMEEPTEEPAPEPTEEPAPEPTEEMVEETAELMSDTSKSIATLLSENPNFSTLVEAITAAGIQEPAPDSPVTIFAPTNDAFAAVDPALMERFLADPSGELTRILQYHLVNGAVKAADVAADEDGRVDTLAGEPLDLASLGLVTTDIEGSNGVIHVIDSVLVPPTVANTIRAEQLAAEGTPVIRIWADNTRKPALDQVEAAFEDEYGVELLIEEVGFGNIRSNFLIAGPAGEGPDIIVGAHDWLGELVASGLLSTLDLGDLTDQFTPASIDAFTYDGELYGLPNATENVAFFINTDLVPECPATWEEVYQISADLHAADENQYGFVRMEGDPYHFYPIQTAFGGYVFARDENGSYDPTQVGVGDEGSIAAGQWWERMVTEGLQPPAVTWDIQHEMFEDGSAAMQVTGPWSTQRTIDSGIPFQICNLPSETAEGKPFLGAQGFMVSAFAKDPLLAQIFLTEFVATPEVMQAFYDTDPRPSAFVPVLETLEDPNIAAFGAAGVNADPMPAIPEMSSVWEAWGNAIVLVAQGSDTAESAFTTAQEQIVTAIEGN
jgi:maltose/maltodextrin transport system substrate-binding protein/arabinogalactan oligomer/maltooligosaccharide transport system substrate-binding protein